MINQYYKYSTFININDFKELPKKIKMLKCNDRRKECWKFL